MGMDLKRFSSLEGKGGGGKLFNLELHLLKLIFITWFVQCMGLKDCLVLMGRILPWHKGLERQFPCVSNSFSSRVS